MMQPPEVTSPQKRPRAAVIIGRLYFWGGVLLLGFAVLLIGWGYLLYRYQDAIEGERIGLFWIASLFAGIPIGVLGLALIIAGVGLSRMRKWGLIFSYVPLTMWLWFDILHLRRVNIAIAQANVISIMAVTTEVYLTQTYYKYFKQR
jgi:hypothetical protein